MVSTAYSGIPSARATTVATAFSGMPGTRPAKQLAHVRFGQRLEIERDEVALAGAPILPAVDQIWSGKCHDVDRQPAAEVEQVVDEVERARIGEVHVLEDEGDRAVLGDPLEEGAPRAEELVRGQCRPRRRGG